MVFKIYVNKKCRSRECENAGYENNHTQEFGLMKKLLTAALKPFLNESPLKNNF